MLRGSFLEGVTFELNQKVKEEMEGTCGIESGREGKREGHFRQRNKMFKNVEQSMCYFWT